MELSKIDELIYKCGEIIDEYNEQFSNKSQISDETNELLKELIKISKWSTMMFMI